MKTFTAATLITFLAVTAAACDNASGGPGAIQGDDASAPSAPDAGTIDSGRNEDSMNPRPYDGDSILDALLAETDSRPSQPQVDSRPIMPIVDAPPPSNEFKYPEVISRLKAVPQNVFFIFRNPTDMKDKLGIATGDIPFDQMCTKKNFFAIAKVWNGNDWQPIFERLPVAALAFATTMDIAKARVTKTFPTYLTVDTWIEKLTNNKSLDLMIDNTNRNSITGNDCQPIPSGQ